jgi:hypothetical protein
MSFPLSTTPSLEGKHGRNLFIVYTFVNIYIENIFYVRTYNFATLLQGNRTKETPNSFPCSYIYRA